MPARGIAVNSSVRRRMGGITPICTNICKPHTQIDSALLTTAVHSNYVTPQQSSTSLGFMHRALQARMTSCRMDGDTRQHLPRLTPHFAA
eukprot:31900-Eustigmatos_ZCMA.PRE.1